MNTQNLLKCLRQVLKENNKELINLLKLDADTKQLKEWDELEAWIKCDGYLFGRLKARRSHQELKNTPQFGSIDILGRRHKTVIIGAQEWMAENLFCPELGWHYDNAPKNSEGGHGTLHNHFAIPAIQEILPDGWRVPKNGDWDKLIQFVGKPVGKKLKSEEGWVGDGGGTDEYGFRVLPADNRYGNDSYLVERGHYAFFWSSSAYDGLYAWFLEFGYISAIVRRYAHRSNGFSVRCVRDLK